VLIDALVEAMPDGLGRLTDGASRHTDDEVAGYIRVMIGRVDSPLARVSLARVVVALREQRMVDDYLAAAALVDLDSPHSVLLCATALYVVRASHALANAAPTRSRRRNTGFVAHA
jgi:hypothetical protein